MATIFVCFGCRVAKQRGRRTYLVSHFLHWKTNRASANSVSANMGHAINTIFMYEPTACKH